MFPGSVSAPSPKPRQLAQKILLLASLHNFSGKPTIEASPSLSQQPSIRKNLFAGPCIKIDYQTKAKNNNSMRFSAWRY